MKSLMLLKVWGVLVLAMLCGVVKSKECTNIPTQLSSHSLRYELLSSKNESWKEEMYSHYHLTPTDDSAWSKLHPRKMLKEEEKFDWMMMYRQIKNSGGVKGIDGILNEVSLHDVRIEPNSMHGIAQQTNLEYLLMLDVDSLVWSFRKTAGLETLGNAYGGWEAPNVELRGHFVGHYLSASAQMWASTHNESLKQKMSAVVSALSTCQEKMGSGYVSAFPSELFDRFEAIKPVWAPYYTIHKIMAGLLDQYMIAGNDHALKMTTWMAEYFYNRVQNVITKYTIERHWRSLNEETGGMNDVLYRLYTVTGDPTHLLLAHLFDKPCFLGPLALKADDISGFHANTHIPVVVGTQMRYEITGDPLYKEIGTFFMDIVNSSHSYATGGTSVGEFWSDPKRLASTLQTENEESCTTYNMLKVSRHLFRWTKEMAYADYYERALTNGVLSIQRGIDPGVMIYMLPLKQGGSKAQSYHKWGTQFDSFWCCYGTGIESFSKLGDSIYFEEKGNSPGLYIIQYIPSSLDWKTGQVLVSQKIEPVFSWDNRLRVTITISSNGHSSGASSTLNLRIPTWTHSSGAKATLNGKDLSLPTPGNFLTVAKTWGQGNKITLELPMILRTEAIQDDRPEYASVQAILYGPYLLAGHSSGDWDIVTKSTTALSDLITPVPADYNANLISLMQESGNTTFVLTNSNQSIQMEKYPEAGTNAAISSTFRLISLDKSSVSPSQHNDLIGKQVMLELFDLPEMFISHQGQEQSLGIAASSDEGGSLFRVAAGLDGQGNTVSLESESQKGCFISSGVNYGSSSTVKLSCNTKSSDAGFKQSATFILGNGISEYHPISFVAKGAKRNFVLSPLLSFRDESYTVYFNIQS
ncbi:putative U-box domain-containing protein 4-like [Capsicum annuum]|uniref:Alpha-L-arabinofuranosidase B arabinose-binding domain-containing protein n=1 Tax=Capsicum annuum TaxID=4072 RepID=A0A2G2YC13_CAPAN|nr:uncharacterized protein LOC107850296 [Capsicum annuum]KAF3649534.1 putative U-box domain-containing protein 4-like [Capsicum annuum]PHT67091.1 hypothetical protein T459_31516 [Capsicum annuum]